MSKSIALRRRLILSGLGATMLAAFPAIHAQDNFPSRPITLIVPFPAGGSTDLAARLIAKYAGDELGQTIIVENRGGAGGSIGMTYVARAKADGYTIGMATVSTHGSNPAVYPNLTYDPIKDFVPVSNVAGEPSVFMVHPSVPAKTMKEFMEMARANPGKFSFASPGQGSLGHVNIEHFMMQADIKLLHVPYKGAGPALNDAMSGQVNAMTNNLGSSLPHIKKGKLRALAVLSAKRSPELPDVPTYTELGIKNMTEAGWFGIVAPAGTPPEVVNKLSLAVQKATRMPEFVKKLSDTGGTPIGNTPEQFGVQIKDALARYAEVAKKANIKLD
jgi:tripartite-type tricarboxylate transporter receptor subunit TctC